MSEKKTSTVSITIPLWVLVPVVWLNFFWPNTPSLILIGFSIFFAVLAYVIVFFVYADFLAKKKITFKQAFSEKSKDSPYSLALQIASVISFAYTAWAGAYATTLTILVLIYIVANIFLIGWKVHQISENK